MSGFKKLWIAIGVLIVLSPIGVILPAMFKAGGAWGEWGLDEIEKVAGFIPDGMKRLGEIWKAPLPDYSLPSQGEALTGKSLGYVATAAIGVAFVSGLMFFLAKLLVRKNGAE